MHKEWTLLLGRFQVPKPHKGHVMLVETLLEENKNVVIGIREEDGTDTNPYTIEERKSAFEKIFYKEIGEGRVKILALPDIIEVAYGRTPGWKIYHIDVPEEIKKITGTSIREKS